MKNGIWAVCLMAVGAVSAAELTVASRPGEVWWGGATTFGRSEPFGVATNAFAADLRRTNYSNQAAPLLLSNKGRYIWNDEAFAFAFTNGVITATSDAGAFVTGEASDGTLRGALLAAAKNHFPASGLTPDLDLIAKPQWNTWVELTYFQNQKDILAYVKAAEVNGFPHGGVLMIDDTWQFGYGVWEFDPRRFADPKAMVDELHRMGWKVMVWVCPFVSMDSPGYREMAFGMLDAGKKCAKGGLVEKAANDPLVVDWWNGRSASIDFSHPLGADWFARQLKRLQETTGVDGFKLDAGDIDTYPQTMRTQGAVTPAAMCEAYAKIGLQFPLNEYRACWKMGGQPLVQRLCDKEHSWDAVQRLIPEMIAAGLLGHPFVCPDMIGSGSWLAFAPDAPHPYDPELFVRSAQIHALAPMMQFSAAPWRLLKGEHLDAVRAAAWTRQKFAPRFVELAKMCAKTGEPMLRNLEYAYPGHGWENIKDEFLMGDFLLVAPQTVKGAMERTVVIPPGRWVGDDGVEVTGPAVITVKTPLSRLPYFEKILL